MWRIHLRLCQFIFGGLGFLVGCGTSARKTWAGRAPSLSGLIFWGWLGWLFHIHWSIPFSTVICWNEVSFDWKISLTNCFISQRKLLWLIDRGNIGRGIKAWKMLLNRNSSAPLNHVKLSILWQYWMQACYRLFFKGKKEKIFLVVENNCVRFIEINPHSTAQPRAGASPLLQNQQKIKTRALKCSWPMSIPNEKGFSLDILV